jgi:hypothetical protein
MKSDRPIGKVVFFTTGLALVFCTVGGVLRTGLRADDLSCKIVRDALLAMTAVKYDAKIVTTATGRAPIKNEEIYTLDATYHQVLQRWIKMPTSPARELVGEKKIDASFTGCHRLSDGTIDGEPVAIYAAKTNNRTLIAFSGDLKLWISLKRGMPLRSEANTAIPILGPSHTVKTYAYDNVRPPPT